MKLLGEMEEVATQQIVLTAPAYFFPQGKHDGNPYQIHKSEWTDRSIENTFCSQPLELGCGEL